MASRESLIELMNLVLGINSKDSDKVVLSLNNLSSVTLNSAQKDSFRVYEDSLVSICIEDEAMYNFIKSDIFNNQTIFDARYIYTISEISKRGMTAETLSAYLSSDLQFEDPFKQYRYCYLLSERSIETFDSELIQIAIQKMHEFVSSQPDFIAPEYGA